VAALIGIGVYTAWHGAAIPFLESAPGMAAALTFVWIVGLTNAYNFMDGIDGLAAGQAVIAGLAWCGIGIALRTPAPALIGVLAAGASAGFLVHNWPPARIFMGDVGAAFLGYTFAVLPLITAPTRSSVTVASVLAVGVFVFDTAFTFLRRMVAGENVFRAHRSHLYQRLTATGLTHRTVTLFYSALAAVLAAAALVVAPASHYAAVGCVVAGSAVSATTWLAVRRQERRRHTLRHAAQSR
jgi:UDP-N-acetylmuramyl pentapeptide phosphotransferase/UDP-N-acetylglucosamine-1-phosphate transferase